VSGVAIRGARLLDPERTEPSAESLLVEGGRIVDRLPAGRPAGDDWRTVDLDGHWIAPGFVDLHFHGELFTAPVDRFGEAVDRAARAMAAKGTTAFLATTLAWPHERLCESVGALVECVEAQGSGAARCLGLHLEGPWISSEAPGAMDAGCTRPFDPARDTAVLDRAGRALRMVTLAPERDGAADLLKALEVRGVLASLGHSRAGPEEIDAGIAGGLRHVTHLFNAMGPMHHRAPGVPGTVLTRDALSCDLICDGHHVHPSMVDLAARALRDRLVLISDRVDLPDHPADAEEGEPARLADGTLAGSQLSLDGAVRNARLFAGLGPCEAVAACTLRPARLLGLENEHGTLRPGARADLAVLDEGGRVVETWIGGSPVRH
jgi:N-acetylglucosamine-6-phosphate deacetylase